MKLLVLGGTGFVGRHVVLEALAHGWSVTTFNRGETDPAALDPRVRHVAGDRTRPADLAPLTSTRWDAVVDTWSGAPTAVRDAAQALEPVAARYLHVSSASVYATLGDGPSEATPTVVGDPDGAATDYAADKRGAELAAERAFGADRVLHARAGLILGPHEDIGRLPWWLGRLAAGGPTVAPGPPDLGFQHIDARDLARFLLEAAVAGLHGAFNVVGRPGAFTMGDLLETAREVTGDVAELVWVPAETLLAAGVQPWMDLPIWLPADDESRGLLHVDVRRAHAAGLRQRPLGETITDTWDWLQTVGGTPRLRPDRPRVGLDPEREREVLAAFTTP